MTQEEKKTKASNLRKVDNRIRLLIENGAAKNHRSMFIIVGDHGKDQVVFLYHLLTKALIEDKASKRILWCYKKDLGFTSHRNKKMKKLSKKVRSGIIADDDPFQLFITSSKITYCKYTDSHRILGNTFTMAILQDFEAMTPNLLARTVETVKGGGLVIMLLATDQLANLDMDVHQRFRTEAHRDVVARFNQRFMKTLSGCPTCMMIDDRLNVLSYGFSLEQVPPRSIEHKRNMLDGLEEVNELTKPLIEKCATVDQRNAVLKLADIIAEKSLRTTVALTAGRGRGKSAALGLAIAAAVAHQYSNIFVTAPSPENLKTLFEFIFVGFDALGYQDNRDYTIVKSTNPEFKDTVVRVNITMSHRQTIQYIHPTDSSKLGQAELVCIDEAAAIPLPLVKDMLGPYLVFLSSTISGYEGTGRSLSLKLISQLRTQAGQSANVGEDVALSGRKLEEMTLTESIRYASRDPVERWLNGLLCLEASISRTPECCLPDACRLFYVNRDQLFNYSKVSEAFLQKLMALFVSSHYKNSPNDLQMLSDAPAHHIFVLLGHIGAKSTGLPDILCAVQVSLEGEISKASIMKELSRGKRPSGDLIPWTVSQQYDNSDFGSLSGARIVRIATHPDCIKMGYGTKALKLLEQYYEGKMTSLDEREESTENSSEEAPLLQLLSARCPERLDYLGVSYGLTPELLRFWRKSAFSPVYLRQTENELTGEHSCIMLKRINVDEDNDSDWLNTFWTDFRGRFMELLASSFRSFKPVMALTILDQNKFLSLCGDIPVNSYLLLSAFEIQRLDKYKRDLVDYHQILDLVPTLARLFFKGRVRVKLPQIQQLVLLTFGLQHRGVEAVAKEMDLAVGPVLGQFQKAVSKITEELQKRQHMEVEATMPAVDVELDNLKPLKQSLEDELKEAAAAVNLSQYAIKGSDNDWSKALAGDSAVKNIVSIKGFKSKRKAEDGENTTSFKHKDKKMRKDKKFKKK